MGDLVKVPQPENNWLVSTDTVSTTLHYFLHNGYLWNESTLSMRCVGYTLRGMAGPAPPLMEEVKLKPD